MPVPGAKPGGVDGEVQPIGVLLEDLGVAHLVGDVHAPAGVAEERAVRGEPRRAVIFEVPVLAVVATESIGHLEGAAVVERRNVALHAVRPVVGVHALEPAAADLLRERSSGELQPGPVEVGAAHIRTGDPDEHGDGVGDRAESSLALGKGGLRGAAVGDVGLHGDEPAKGAGVVEHRLDLDAHDVLSAGFGSVVEFGDAGLAGAHRRRHAGDFLRVRAFAAQHRAGCLADDLAEGVPGHAGEPVIDPDDASACVGDDDAVDGALGDHRKTTEIAGGGKGRGAGPVA